MTPIDHGAAQRREPEPEPRGVDIGPPAGAGEPDVVPAAPEKPAHVRAVPPPEVEPSTRVGRPDDTRIQPLIEPERASSFRSKWDAIQTAFIDDPRAAVARADELVDELLRELSDAFAEQRRALRVGLDQQGPTQQGGASSTEEMRLALQRYRDILGRFLAM